MPRLSVKKWESLRSRYDVFCANCQHDAAHHRLYSTSCSFGSSYLGNDCKCKEFGFDEFGEEVRKLRNNLKLKQRKESEKHGKG